MPRHSQRLVQLSLVADLRHGRHPVRDRRVEARRSESGRTAPYAPAPIDEVVAAIREQAVTSAVSPVSAVPEVRARLLELQRAEISEGGIVVEGRDIGSVVWPQAQVKVYLTADAGARAVRRAAEEGGSDVSATEASLRARDAIDSGRATAPLVMPDGAHHIDTTPYTLEEVISQVVALVAAAADPA